GEAAYLNNLSGYGIRTKNNKKIKPTINENVKWITATAKTLVGVSVESFRVLLVVSTLFLRRNRVYFLLRSEYVFPSLGSGGGERKSGI
ncbi:hypothetical protein A2U01_0056189, partial [Trifolium medium]|nr:hypothetical protein [Trifolium medium]